MKLKIYYQQATHGKYTFVIFEGEPNRIIEKLLSWQLWYTDELGRRVLLVPNRVTGIEEVDDDE